MKDSGSYTASVSRALSEWPERLTMVTTTTFTIASSTLAGPLAIVVTLLLLALLVQKEMTSVAKDSRTWKLGRALSIAIVPLLIAFILIAAVRLIEILH